MNCPYKICRMRNLCKTHCVREALHKDGYELRDGVIVQSGKSVENDSAKNRNISKTGTS